MSRLPRYKLTLDVDTLTVDNAAAGAEYQIVAATEQTATADSVLIADGPGSTGRLDETGQGEATIPASPSGSIYILRVASVGIMKPFRMPKGEGQVAALIAQYAQDGSSLPDTPLNPSTGTSGSVTRQQFDNEIAARKAGDRTNSDAIAEETRRATAVETHLQEQIDDIPEGDKKDQTARDEAAAAQRTADDAAAAAATAGQKADAAGQVADSAHDAAAQAAKDAADAVADATANTTRIEAADRTLDEHTAELSDMSVSRQEAWIAADLETASFADITGSRQAREKVQAGELPLNLNWQTVHTFNTPEEPGDSALVVARLARQPGVERHDYRFLVPTVDGADIRLDSPHIGRFAFDADYVYYVFGSQQNPVAFGNMVQNGVLRMQHRGTQVHTAYHGDVPELKEAIQVQLDAFDERLSDDEDELASRTHLEKGQGPPDGNTPGDRPNDFYLDLSTGQLYQYSLLARQYVLIEDFALQADVDGKQDTLTASQKISMLSMSIDPGVVEQQDPATRKDAITGDFRLALSSPDLLDGDDVWLRVFGSGQPLMGQREQVDTSPARVQEFAFSITAQQADNIVSNDTGGDTIGITVRFYGGNTMQDAVIREVVVPLHIVETPRVDDLQAKLPELGNGEVWFNAGRETLAADLGTLVGMLRPSGFAKVGVWGDTAGLKDNTVLAVASGGTTIVMRNVQRLPAGVQYDNNTGLLTLPLGVWRITTRARFEATSGQRANIKLAQLVDVEGPTAEVELSASEGYDYRNDPGGSVSLETSALLQVVDLGSGNDTAVLRAQGSFRGAGVAVNCTSAVLELERIG